MSRLQEIEKEIDGLNKGLMELGKQSDAMQLLYNSNRDDINFLMWFRDVAVINHRISRLAIELEKTIPSVVVDSAKYLKTIDNGIRKSIIPIDAFTQEKQ